MKKIIFPFLLFCGTAVVCNSQAPNWAWAKKIVGKGMINALRCDTGGNIYITGSFTDTIYLDTVQLISRGGSDIFAACYDNNGNVRWAIDAGGRLSDAGEGLYLDAYRHLLVCGSYTDTASFGTLQLQDTLTNMFIAWLDVSNGQCEQVKKIGQIDLVTVGGGTGTNSLNNIFIDKAGNYYLQGSTGRYTDFGGQGLNGTFIVKYDSLFNLIWLSGTCGIEPICIDDSANLYLCTSVSEPCVFQNTPLKADSGQGTNGFIAQLEPSGGTMQWIKKETGNEVVMTMLTGNNGQSVYPGGFYYSGNCTLDDSTILSDSINQGVFVCRKYPSGDMAWVRSWPIPYGWTDAITDQPNGDVALTIITSTSLSYIILLDSSGTVLWTKPDSGTHGEQNYSAISTAFDPAGNLVLAGYVQGQVTFDTFVYHNENAMFIAKLGANPINAVSEIINPGAGLQVFPNPTRGPFNVRYNLPAGIQNCNLDVMDITGKCLTTYSISSPGKIASINREFPPGCYFVNLLANGRVMASAKFVVVK